ncbi:hypothetical protein Pst134EA_032787 [Puccinia striiformis f. sp. tritici]|uniref:uncharacterized protein n=1 Tax=Puccinia striiformis f. sp. tritici TaxID=168172 RepID=UPI0020084B0A|nr:uncharacterized protein Pst134EA_032787 [Puccinia striiformis f. sp. tritici]KAH9441620.1 hypothetical protein Pst134EA_032787 [Puccinia striiformis f. sp. tritici]
MHSANKTIVTVNKQALLKPNQSDSLDIQQATSYSEQCILYGLSEAYQQSDPSDMSPDTPWSCVLEVATPYLVCLQELLDHLTAFSDAGLDFTLRNHNLGIGKDLGRSPRELKLMTLKTIGGTRTTTRTLYSTTPDVVLQEIPPKHSRERNRTINQQTEGIARIFHGTRHSSLKSYYEYGIHPAYTRNEFSFSPAFYASNDPQQGFEYPLHQHLGIVSASTIDPVALMQFDVPISVLHGFKRLRRRTRAVQSLPVPQDNVTNSADQLARILRLQHESKSFTRPSTRPCNRSNLFTIKKRPACSMLTDEEFQHNYHSYRFLLPKIYGLARSSYPKNLHRIS